MANIDDYVKEEIEREIKFLRRKIKRREKALSLLESGSPISFHCKVEPNPRLLYDGKEKISIWSGKTLRGCLRHGEREAKRVNGKIAVAFAEVGNVIVEIPGILW